MRRLTRLSISKTSVLRHHQEVAAQIEQELEQEEREVPASVLWKDVEAREWIDAQDPIVNHASVSADGAKALIRGEGYKEIKIVSVSEAEEQPEKPRQPAPGEEPREEQEVRGRQDDLRLTRHSYRAILGDKATFAPALETELTRRRVRQAAKITTVNDGADWIWDLMQDYLPEWRVEVLDWPHALENLAKASNAAWGEGTAKAREWLAERKTELWNGQVAQMRTALVQLPRRYKDRGRQIRQVREYTARHAPRMTYDRFRAEGRPIGSGTVESAAKNVVAWRMKRGGQSWSRPGASRMLAALGELHSNRWDDWSHRRRPVGAGRTRVVFTRAHSRQGTKAMSLAAA